MGDTDIATPTNGVHADIAVELVPAYRIAKDGYIAAIGYSLGEGQMSLQKH